MSGGNRDDEAIQREAEHKAAALHWVGWHTGAGATIWSRVVKDQLASHESARERFGIDRDRESWERLHGTALTLVVAIHQVLAFERRVRRLTGDAELAKARKHFDSVAPHAEALRDIVTHLDDYGVGEGQRQTGERGPPVEQTYVQTYLYWTNGGGTTLRLEDEQLNLRGAAHAAVKLAEVVERVRAKHLLRVEREANAALRRRHGLPPE
jgi:hypothetical protein